MARALISVSDKSGIVDLGRTFISHGIELISTGGTKQILEAAGLPVVSVEEVTGFPEILDGRVKTLHPMIHGGLLARRDLESHMSVLRKESIQPIDFVVVNLYPFKETIASDSVQLSDAIENIDIGGPSMIRSAAKNHDSVTVLVDSADYSDVINELNECGEVSLDMRKKLAAKAFRHTAAYDSYIANYLTKEFERSDFIPETVTLNYELKQKLRYGENSQQQAEFYQSSFPPQYSLARAIQLHGKELSYNNLRDADAALRIIREFSEPAAVAVKHMNPCGVGNGSSIEEAYQRCYQADSISIFGGIVALNRPLSMEIAEHLSQLFIEIVIAPSFDEEAFNLLSKKKNIRLLVVNMDTQTNSERELVSVLGGVLIQDQDFTGTTADHEWTIMTSRKPTEKQLEAMKFAWKVVKHTKSNAIVIATAHQTLGIGAGQMNRVGAAKIALEQAKQSGVNLSQAVLASDAFFPMSDSVELAHEYGIEAIVQSGGSIKDQESVTKADEYQMTMVATHIRHFRH